MVIKILIIKDFNYFIDPPVIQISLFNLSIEKGKCIPLKIKKLCPAAVFND